MKPIRTKIRTLLLSIVLTATVLISLVCVYSLMDIHDSVVSASSTLGATAGESSSTAMETQLLERLAATAETGAAVADEKLGKQQTYTQILAHYANALYARPQGYVPHDVYPPDPSTTGANTAQLLLAEGLDRDDLAAEIGLAANLNDLLLAVVEQDLDITADYIATESGFVIMVDPDADTKPATIDGRQRGWYKSAVESDRLIWTDIFSDAMGRGLAITCAAPVHDAAGQTKAVVGIGALMKNLNAEIINTSIGETGYLFVVNQRGEIIISPKIVYNDDGSFEAENLLLTGSDQVSSNIEKVLSGENNVSQVEFEGRQVYMACHGIETLPWGVVAVMDVDEALLPASQVSSAIGHMTDTTISSINFSIRGASIALLAVVVAMLILVFILSGYYSKRLTTPLARLTAGVEEISGGKLDTHLDLHTNDEIYLLSSAINDMTASLRAYIDDLTRLTAEKERISSELAVATQIQASVLPCIFPAFPEHAEFDIFASMRPAREVGGAFYDFFLADENHLCMVMAEVSGTGVPAALFTVISKTLIKNHIQNGENPGKVLTGVNTQLCESNNADMFVTCWLGILDTATGLLVFGNAGHNQPLIRRGGGSFEYLCSEPGFALAGLPNVQYGRQELTLERGDVLFLYTNGVTRSPNTDGEAFGAQRLRDALNSAGDCSMSALLPAVSDAVDGFVKEADQLDDITMLGLKFTGKE